MMPDTPIGTLGDDNLDDINPSQSITWNQLKSRYNSFQLSFLTINARSLKNKFNEFLCKISLLKEKFSFIVITETHLNKDSDFNYEIPSYKSENFYRLGNNGGGIKLYYLDHIFISRVDSFSSNVCEHVLLEANVPGYGAINVCGIYRPPDKPIHEFCGFLECMFEHYNRHSLVLLGDFNINILNANNISHIFYQNLLQSFGYKNEITLPTYTNPSTHLDTSCLDHIVHNINAEANSYVLKPNFSDHYPVAVIFQKNIENKPIEIRFRDYGLRNCSLFLENIDREFSNFNLHECNIDEETSCITIFLTNLINKYFPVKTKSISYRRLKTPWLTNKLKQCIDKKHRWFRMSRGGIITHESYKNYCVDLRKVLYVAKSNYYSRKFRSLSNDCKKNWEILNQLLGKEKKLISNQFDVDGEIITNGDAIANHFNDYFITHPRTIQSNIPVSNRDFSNLIPYQNTSFQFDECTENEVLLEIDCLKKTGGIYDISSKFLKLCKHRVSVLLSKLYNRCLTEGVFPSQLKLAKVTPVFKKGNKRLIANHRPISVLSNISKIFESILCKRINTYFENTGLLNVDQYGFRKQKNTEMAIFSLLERVIPAFENRAFAITVFLDFSACFDTVDRNILLDKLKRYGFRGTSHHLISSYFENRTQQVIFQGHSSAIKHQNLGVVQGSRGGPLYYDIYSGDLAKICFEDEFLMFADDTCLTYFGNDIDQLANHVNDRLSLIYDWCCFNRLSLNPVKCKFMVFTNRSYDTSNTIIRLANNPIERVSSFKYLGITIDDKLKYDDHIKVLCDRISRMCGISYKLKDHFNMSTAKNMYYACVYSVLVYCICVWGGLLTSTHKADRLSHLHSKTVTNLFSKFFSNTNCIFKNMNILKLIDIHNLYAGIYMYKVLKLNQCPTVQANLNLSYPSHTYGTRHRNDLVLPFPNVNAIRINYVYQCTSVWNNIPENIKSKETLKSFKRELSKYLVNSY